MPSSTTHARQIKGTTLLASLKSERRAFGPLDAVGGEEKRDVKTHWVKIVSRFHAHSAGQKPAARLLFFVICKDFNDARSIVPARTSFKGSSQNFKVFSNAQAPPFSNPKKISKNR